MHGTRAVCIAWLAVATLGGGCSGKKAEPPPSREAPPPPVARAANALDAGAPVTPPADAAPADAAVPPDPIASLFRRRYTPDESLSGRMQRRIRYHLRDKTKAPIALHHITYVPQAGDSGDVFAIYDYSTYEDCVLGYATRKEGRAQCAGESVMISDLTYSGPDHFGRPTYPDKEAHLNQECMTVGVVRAHFEPPGPDVPADAGGALTLSSAKLEGLCEVRNYNRLFVADLDGDERLEMYLDVTTSEEKVNREPGVRSEPERVYIGHRFKRNLYLFDGGASRDFALPLELGDWEDLDLPSQEPVELRDVNHDRRLDVIQRELCITWSGSKSVITDRRCDDRPRWMAEWLYDAERDAWFRKQDTDEGAKDPASGSAKDPASGSAKDPASGKPASGSAAPP